jgi:hypothetical protein
MHPRNQLASLHLKPCSLSVPWPGRGRQHVAPLCREPRTPAAERASGPGTGACLAGVAGPCFPCKQRRQPSLGTLCRRELKLRIMSPTEQRPMAKHGGGDGDAPPAPGGAAGARAAACACWVLGEQGRPLAVAAGRCGTRHRSAPLAMLAAARAHGTRACMHADESAAAPLRTACKCRSGRGPGSR